MISSSSPTNRSEVNGHALIFPSGKRGGLKKGALGEADFAERRERAFSGLDRGNAHEPEWDDHVLQRRECGKEIEALKNEAAVFETEAIPRVFA